MKAQKVAAARSELAAAMAVEPLPNRRLPYGILGLELGGNCAHIQ